MRQQMHEGPQLYPRQHRMSGRCLEVMGSPKNRLSAVDESDLWLLLKTQQ